jgi:hypothetical protein
MCAFHGTDSLTCRAPRDRGVVVGRVTRADAPGTGRTAGWLAGPSAGASAIRRDRCPPGRAHRRRRGWPAPGRAQWPVTAFPPLADVSTEGAPVPALRRRPVGRRPSAASRGSRGPGPRAAPACEPGPGGRRGGSEPPPGRRRRSPPVGRTRRALARRAARWRWCLRSPVAAVPMLMRAGASVPWAVAGACATTAVPMGSGCRRQAHGAHALRRPRRGCSVLLVLITPRGAEPPRGAPQRLRTSRRRSVRSSGVHRAPAGLRCRRGGRSPSRRHR